MFNISVLNVFFVKNTEGGVKMNIHKNVSCSNISLLYEVNTKVLEQYEIIAEHYFNLLLNDSTDKLDTLNIFISICDIWLALKTYQETIMLNQHKCMNFPPAALLLKLIEENSTLKSYIAGKNLNSEQQYVLSYYVSVETMQWLRIALQNIERHDLIRYYQEEVIYGELVQNNDKAIFVAEMNNQTLIIKAMMQNIRETNDFHFAISQAITKTNSFLTSVL